MRLFDLDKSDPFESLSAKFEELDGFTWYKYGGSRSVKVVFRIHERSIKRDTVFGIRPVRYGNFYVVFPDLYHVNFTVSSKEANKLFEHGTKIKRPDIQNKLASGGKRVVNKVETASEHRAWDAVYFRAARIVRNEDKEGIEYANYQWRRVGDPDGIQLKKGGRIRKYKKGDIIGMRFIKPTAGGVLIDQQFNRFAVTKDIYDQLLAASSVLPKNKWPEGGFSQADLENSAREQELIEKEKRAEERRMVREREAVLKRERELELREKRRQEDLKRKEEASEIQERAKTLEQHIKEVRKTRTVPMSDKEIVKQIKKRRTIRAEDLGLRDEHLSDDHVELDLDLDNLTLHGEPEEAVKEETSKGVSVKEMMNDAIADLKSGLPKLDLSKFADEPEELNEDDSDVEYDDEEIEEEEDFEEEPEPDLPEIEEPDPIADADPELEIEDPDDIDKALAELDSVDEDDLDEGEAEEEVVKKPKSAEPKRIFEEGNVVVFHQDRAQKREFVIFEIANLPESDHIFIYKLYDMTNEPDDYRTVRIDKRQKRKIEDMADFVRKLPVRELIAMQSVVEDLPKNKEPIES